MEIKKRFFMVLAIMLVFTLGSAITVVAAPTPVKVTAYQGIKIIYNGKELSGTNQPYIINNVTYVPFRLLMENFSKNVTWDAANYQVVITDNGISADEKLQLSNQIVDLKNKNTELQKTITTLNTKIATLEAKKNNTDTSDIKKALEDAFEDAGDDYFSDDDIEFSFSISGDDDKLVYSIEMDCSDADKYRDITKVSDSNLKKFLDKVKSEIKSEINDTDFEGADITGKLFDSDDSRDYVKYDGSKYTISWDDDDDLRDVEDDVIDYFKDKDAGEYYFRDDDVVVDISLAGDDDEITYKVEIDCSRSKFKDINEINRSDLLNFLNTLKSQIEKNIDNTDFEDADIVGYTYDENNSKYYITYKRLYTFSWN